MTATVVDCVHSTECDYTLSDLKVKPHYTTKVETRMKDASFSTGKMIHDEMSLLDEMSASEALLAAMGITRQQISDKINLLKHLAMTLGDEDQSILSGEEKMILFVSNMKQPIVTDDAPLAATPRFPGVPVRIPTDPHWKRAETTVWTYRNRFRITVSVWNGSQTCPFQKSQDKTYHGYDYGDRDILVENLMNNTQIMISDLAAHMVEAHGYFERSPFGHYDIPVEKLIDVLDIKLGQSYQPFGDHIGVWRHNCMVNQNMFEFESKDIIYSTEEFVVFRQVDGGITIYAMKDANGMFDGCRFRGRKGIYYMYEQKAIAYEIDVEKSLQILDNLSVKESC